MKSRKIEFIFIFQIISLLALTQCDHVAIIRCAESPECLDNLDWNVLQVIKENLANYTQPCENFWDYACGAWTAAPYYDHVDNFGVMANYYADNLIHKLKELQQQHRQIVKENENNSKLVKQIVTYFKSCLNSGNYYLNMPDYLNEIPFTDIWNQKEFKWNFIFENNATLWQDFNWLKLFAVLRRYGLKDIFLKETVGFARYNSTQYVLHLKLPSAAIHFENKYRVLEIMEEFDLLFSSIDKQNYRQLAQDMHDLDQDLSNLYKKYKQTSQYYIMTLKDLQILCPQLDWSLYFELLLNQQLLSETAVEFSGDYQYFQDLLALIKRKPKRIIFSYLIVRFGQYLQDIRPLITPRECLLNTNVMFPLGVNFIYNQFLYKNRLQDEVILQNMFSDLKQEFFVIINQNKFSLSHSEMQYLQNKLQKMELRIGNLPFKLPNMNRYYSSARLNVNNFHHNHLEMLKFRTLRQHQDLLKAFNTETFYINDDIITLRNAPYFVFQRNVLVIPMLFLQLPFYHYKQHSLFQYSLVGWIMAHEMSHAFDANGLLFDSDGNEHYKDLQLHRKPLYLAMLQCLTKYSSTVSLNERMADVNGLQLAWQAFRKQLTFVSNADDYQFLKQLFFINFAQFFCGSLPHAIDHDRDDVRVRQTVANMQEFSDAFQCSKQAKESPKEKCNIWRK